MTNPSKLLLFALNIFLFLLLYSCSTNVAAPVVAPSAAPEPAPVPAPSPTSTQQPISAPPEELQLDLVATAPPSYQLNVEAFYLKPNACMLGSLAMLVKYDDPSVEFADFMGYTGWCARGFYESSNPRELKFTDPNDRWAGIMYATRNLGYSIVVGIVKEGRIDPTNTPQQVVDRIWSKWDPEQVKIKLKSDAKKIEYFKDTDEAFDFLKRVVASGYPVEVHINLIHLYNNNPNVQISHHMVVNGYDENFVYMNDPNDPAKPMKLKFRVDLFKSAWNNCKETMQPANNGPLWMFFVKKTGKAKAIDDILAWNKLRAKKTPSEIRLLSKDFPADKIEPSKDSLSTYVKIQDFAGMRAEYAKFLSKNGKTEAASLYQQSSELWYGLINSSTRSDDLKKIADLEEKAQSLY